MSKALLDTHTLIWLMSGDSTVSKESVRKIESFSQGNNLSLAAISVWEIAMLEKRGRISLQQPCLSWIQKVLGAPGLSLIPLTPEISVESVHLPGEFHGDPADRMIVATARIHQATLFTRDRKMLQYAKDGYVQCIEV